jgi:hypothetical protein
VDIGWEEVGERVLVPNYVGILEPYRAVLAALSADGLGAALADANAFDARFPPCAPAPEDHATGVRWLAGAALMLALARRGFRVRSLPGEAVLVETPAGDLDPFATVRSLSDRTLGSDDWVARCRSLGLEGVSLEPAAPGPVGDLVPATQLVQPVTTGP